MLRRITPLLAALAVALMSVGSAIAAPAGANGAAASTARAVSLESGIVRELNRVRAQHGLAPMKVSAGLTQAALAHSAAMLRTGIFDHTSADGTTFDRRVLRSYPTKGFAAWTVGENLLYDSGGLDAAGAVQAWMDSPPHRENMLSTGFREVGVGALSSPTGSGDFGTGPVTVITLDFGARVPARTAQRASSARP